MPFSILSTRFMVYHCGNAEVYGNGASIAANMVNGGIALGELSDKIPADVQKKIADYADQIVAGTF